MSYLAKTCAPVDVARIRHIDKDIKGIRQTLSGAAKMQLFNLLEQMNEPDQNYWRYRR